MLSDEEKKGYEEAKLYLTHTGVDDFNLEKHQSENRIWAIETILNLIEKQSKEIEELKEKNNKLMEELDLTTVYISGVYDGEKKVEGKIKAKIEEEKECGSVDGTNEMIIEVLQSLLEKE